MSPRNEWTEFFDGHAPAYEENCFTKNTVAEADFLVKELGLEQGQSILDVGCGTGRHSIELACRGFAVTGLDASPGMLREATRLAAAAHAAVEWIEADATRFSVGRSFDAAICLCEGAFGLLGSADDPIEQPLSILRNISAALKPGARCLFTVLNGYALARKQTPESVRAGAFDPLALAERSSVAPAEGEPAIRLRERAFVPTELRLLFDAAGLDVAHIWGGTAGNWGKRPIDLDEIEIMVVARKPY